MTHPLYLTADEMTMFEKLPANVKEGWELEEEKMTFQDSEEKWALRRQLVRFQDPRLKKLQEKLKKLTGKDLAPLIEETDLSKLGKDDFISLCYAMGPAVLSIIMQKILGLSTSDDDLQIVSGFSDVRHALLHSYATSRS